MLKLLELTDVRKLSVVNEVTDLKKFAVNRQLLNGVASVE
jgi:hypothetical protein